jgi:hypothetical protein
MLGETTGEGEGARPGFDLKELDNDLIVCAGNFTGHFLGCVRCLSLDLPCRGQKMGVFVTQNSTKEDAKKVANQTEHWFSTILPSAAFDGPKIGCFCSAKHHKKGCKKGSRPN